jgi:hypothetical protein
MKISELPKKIRKKALKYQNNDSDILIDAFNWLNTKEGWEYWNKWHFKEVKNDTIVESVIEQFKQRSEAGINKYGVTLDREDLNALEWLQHLQEELMDATLYVQKLKEKLNDKE